MPICWLIFQHMGTLCSWTFKIFSLKNMQPSWTPLLFRTASQGSLSNMHLNRAKSVFSRSRAAVLLTCLLTSLIIEKSMNTMPKMAFSDHSTHMDLHPLPLPKRKTEGLHWHCPSKSGMLHPGLSLVSPVWCLFPSKSNWKVFQWTLLTPVQRSFSPSDTGISRPDVI